MLRRFMKAVAYSPTTYRFAEALERALPPLRYWHRAQYQRHFEQMSTYDRRFSGVYPTFDAAKSEIPSSRPVGYDNLETSTFLGREAPLLPSEYPVLFWLSRLFPESPRVFDFGGYLGVLYNAYRRFDIYPPNLDWTVYDVPAVVAAGESILLNEPDSRLHFTAAFGDASVADILLASGSIHFCEEGFAGMLGKLSSLPQHLIINKMPATDGKEFWTLNNMGPALSPYKVVNRFNFIASIESLGYRLIDTWKNPDLTCYIPFNPDHCVKAFDGLYFQRAKFASLDSNG